MKKNLGSLDISEFEMFLSSNSSIRARFISQIEQLVNTEAKLAGEKVKAFVGARASSYNSYLKAVSEAKTNGKLKELLYFLSELDIEFEPLIGLQPIPASPWSNISRKDRVLIILGEHPWDRENWPSEGNGFISIYDFSAIRSLLSFLERKLGAYGKVTPEFETVRCERNLDEAVSLARVSVNDLLDQNEYGACLLYTSPSPRDRQKSRMPSSA